MENGLKTLLAAAVLATCLASPARAESAKQACEINVLKDAGFLVEHGAKQSAFSVSGHLCSKEAVTDVLQGHLELTGQASDEAVIKKALASSLVHCAYSKALDVALQKAGDGLQSNKMYWFDIPILGSGVPRMGALRGWQRVTCPYYSTLPAAKCFDVIPGQMENAFKSLYHGRFASECAAGAQLSQYAAIHELFGSKMETYFKPDEIFVSSWDDLYRSKSVTYGKTAKMTADLTAQATAKQGAETLVGLSGGIASAYDETYLDSKINRNENFVFMRTSTEGAANLAKKGLKVYADLTWELWEKSETFSKSEISKIGDGKLPSHNIPEAQRMIEILNDPFLKDTIVRVHPKGNWTFAQHLVRLLKINPRTPYYIVIYPSALQNGVFDRWLQFRLDNCGTSVNPGE